MIWIDGTAKDQETLIRIVPQIDEHVGEKYSRQGMTWNYVDNVLEFRINYVKSDARQTKRLGN
jgi:hypothetical protein